MHRTFVFAFALLFTIALSSDSVSGQSVEVRNGATLQVENGSVVDLEGGSMSLGAAGATATLDETSAGRVTGGTLTATRALSSPSSADPAGLGAVISASVDLGDVTVTRGHTAQTDGGNASIKRYYDISPSKNNSNLDATLTHTYHDDELNGLAESELVLFRSTDGGSTWGREGADSRTTSPTGGNTVTLSGITSFSRWTLGSDSNPLPVEMALFEGTTTENGVRLNWRTASEQNNVGFRVERKRAREHGGERAWTEVGFVEGSGTTSEAQRYRFTDAEVPYAADTLAYRLKQVDTGESVHYSEPITVVQGSVGEIQLLGTVPNPVRERATVRFAVPEHTDAAKATMRLYDVLGRRVRIVRTKAEPGRRKMHLDVSNLSSGAYVLRLRIGKQMKTRKLTVVR